MKPARQVYVISDLHLGGEYGAGAHPEDRGFRLCSQVPTLTAFVEALAGRPGDAHRTELIINGDFVDFLAERSTAGASAATWTPFRANPRGAAATLKTIVERDRRFFRALTMFLERGHRLVVLLGNHDLELALPFVRRTLLDELQIGGRHDVEFIYDGEAYIVGDGIIEHGNQYDAWNRVNHSSLRKLRAQQSRHSPDARIGEFIPPPGSRLVSEVINPIKSSYRFVDLLKPETEAVVPLLLALEPGYRRHVAKLATLSVSSVAASVRATVTGDIASHQSSSESSDGDLAARPSVYSPRLHRRPESDVLRVLLERMMPGESSTFLASIDDGVGGDIAAGDAFHRKLGLMQLLSANRRHLLERRLDALRLALGVVQNRRAFERGTESLPEYLKAAEVLASRGFRFVIFGHTHLARDVRLGGGARYLNTGTWADVIRFPAEILNVGNEKEFREFVADMSTGAMSRWIEFTPSYVRLDLDDAGLVSHAELMEYRPGDRV